LAAPSAGVLWRVRRHSRAVSQVTPAAPSNLSVRPRASGGPAQSVALDPRFRGDERNRGSPALIEEGYQHDYLFRLAQHTENLFQLRAQRQVQRLAGGQPAQEPFVVELGEPSLACHSSESALDHRGESRIVAPINKAIRIVGQILADDLHV